MALTDMNCADIQDRDVSTRYVAGTLSAEEEQEFESHFVDCPQCLDAVESETGLREGLRLAAPESAPRAHANRFPFLQAAAGLLLAVSIGLGLWLAGTSGELRTTRAERDQLQRRAGQSEQSSASAKASADKSAALEQRLAALERRTNEAGAAGSLVPAAVFALTTVRGSSPADAGPVNRVTIDRNTKLVVFSLDLPGTTGPADYSVALKDPAGRSLWSGDTFPPSSPDSLSVAVDAPSPFDSLISIHGLVETLVAAIVERSGGFPEDRLATYDRLVSI